MNSRPVYLLDRTYTSKGKYRGLVQVRFSPCRWYDDRPEFLSVRAGRSNDARVQDSFSVGFKVHGLQGVMDTAKKTTGFRLTRFNRLGLRARVLA